MLYAITGMNGILISGIPFNALMAADNIEVTMLRYAKSNLMLVQ